MRTPKFRAWTGNRMHANPLHRCDPHDLLDGKKEGFYKDWILMQYTGLLDKNGKEIYEGDIARCYSKGGEHVYDHPVKLPDFYREIWSSKIVGEDKMWLPADEGEHCDGIEIIGNLYENPELLSNSIIQ